MIHIERRRARRFTSWTAMAAFAAALPAHADTVVDSVVRRVAVTGEITADDVTAIKRAAESSVVSLDSVGGSIYAAIDMGRVIRKKHMTVEVAGGARCFSSCALLYIAGVERRNDGVIGLHRPYLVGKPHSARRIERGLPRMFADVRAFIVEMGVTSEVADVMVHTPPDGMRRYENNEIAALVPAVDPVYDEIRVAREARARAVSTDAYRQLEAEIRRWCGARDSADHAACRDALVATRAVTSGEQHEVALRAPQLAGSVE